MSDIPERIFINITDEDEDGAYGDWSEELGSHEYIRADLSPQWQGIETAPKDGTEILAFGVMWSDVVARGEREGDPAGIWIVAYKSGHWQTNTLGHMRPTHWRQRPEPPTE